MSFCFQDDIHVVAVPSVEETQGILRYLVKPEYLRFTYI